MRLPAVVHTPKEPIIGLIPFSGPFSGPGFSG
jgi:hypothetical protein